MFVLISWTLLDDLQHADEFLLTGYGTNTFLLFTLESNISIRMTTTCTINYESKPRLVRPDADIPGPFLTTTSS